MLKRLRDLLDGKHVRIRTPKAPRTSRTLVGICKTVHKVPGSEQFEIELRGGARIEFTPEVITETFVEGRLPTGPKGGTRRIELA